jgi:hypothetical protein
MFSDELAQGLSDTEALQLFRDKINEIQHSDQIGDEYSDLLRLASCRNKINAPISRVLIQYIELSLIAITVRTSRLTELA